MSVCKLRLFLVNASYAVLSTRGCAGDGLARRPHARSDFMFLGVNFSLRGSLFTHAGVHPADRLLGEKRSGCVSSLPVDVREPWPRVCTPEPLCSPLCCLPKTVQAAWLGDQDAPPPTQVQIWSRLTCLPSTPMTPLPAPPAPSVLPHLLHLRPPSRAPGAPGPDLGLASSLPSSHLSCQNQHFLHYYSSGTEFVPCWLPMPSASWTLGKRD